VRLALLHRTFSYWSRHPDHVWFALSSRCSSDDRKHLVSVVEAQLKDCSDSIKSMEVEARSISDSRIKGKCSQQLSQFKSDLVQLRKDFDRVKAEENRDYLFDVSRDKESVRGGGVGVPLNLRSHTMGS
jgi:hypothetical protein